MMFRPVLYFPGRILGNPTHARTAIEVAKESVLLLWTLNESTTFLRSQPVFFKHFLISAFGVLLLAVANAWKEFGQQVSHEFYLALDLFKVMSTESPLVMRYSKTVNGLEELAHKIGLPRSQVLEPSTQGQFPNTAWRMSHPQPMNDYPLFDSDIDASLNTNPIDAAGIRAEFATFFDPSAGYSSSLFEFPLSEMFSTDLPAS
jgi:hypothetical protein